MKTLWVYLDDERPLPSGYDLLVRTAKEAIELIKAGRVERISLDNDLGIGYTEGKKVAQFIEQAYISGEIEYVEFVPHTANPVAFDEIKMCAYNCFKHKISLR